MRNKITFGIIAVFTMIMMVFAATVFAAEGSIRMTLINQDPSKATPGKYVDLKFQVENIGDGAAPNVAVELVPEYPFSLNPDENAIKTIGNLAAGRLGKDAAVVTYRVRVDEKAVSGANKIKINFRKSDTDVWATQEFDVYVDSITNAISITEVNTVPEEIVPGGKAKIEITVQNIGYNTLRDVSLRMIFSAYNGNALVNLIPLAPVSSSSEKKISFLEPGKSETFVFDVVAEPEALSNIYKVPIILSYFDTAGVQTSINDIVGVVIGSAPEISAQITQSDIVLSGTSGKIKVDIFNKGLTNAKFVNVVPKDSEDVSIISTQKEIYVGSVDSDDYQSFDMEVYVKPTTKEEISIPLTVTYRDPNNKEYTQEIVLSQHMYSAEKAKEMGMSKSKPFPIFWVVVGLAIVGFFVYRHFKKNDKNKK